jgi:hypothetical protein
MDCLVCKKPVGIDQKFISGFTPDMALFLKHAACAGERDPKKLKTMTALRMESLATYHKEKDKAAKREGSAS